LESPLADPSPLADRVYRRLFSAQVIALAGTGLTTIALALLAFDLAGSAAGQVLGTALVLKMVAYVGIAPLIGSFADRLPRRSFLIGMDIVRAALVMCLPFITEIWQIYLLIFLLNACSAGFTPTFQATIPDVLPDDARYTRALSLSRLAYDLENLLSPVLAGLLLTLLSYNALFSINAVTFLISAALVWSVTLPVVRATQEGSGWSNVTFGIRAFLATPRLRGLVALSMAVASAGAMVIVNTVVIVRERFDGSETDVAVAFAAFGAGSMIVALALPTILDRYPDRPFMIAGGAVMAFGLLIGLADPSFNFLLLVWLLLGAGSSLIQTPAGRLLKRSAHESGRPAIFSAQFALSHGCWLLGYAAAGWFSVLIGIPGTFLVLGLVALLATIIALSIWPAADPEEIEHEHAALVHAHAHTHDEHHQHEHEGWEGPEPHEHEHEHQPVRHKHPYIIDLHHPVWPEP